MNSEKKSIIGFVCVMLCCILVIGITIGLLSSVDNTVTADTTADTTDTTDSTKDTTEEPPEIEPEPELEWGYKLPDAHGGTSCAGSTRTRWPVNIAYKSGKKTFNADNVKLTMSYGILSSTEINEYNIEMMRIYMGWDITWFEIYFADEAGNNIHTVRKVEESLIREKYRVVSHVRDGGYYAYNHTEEITIPKELFTESEGTITLCLGGNNIAGEEPGYEVLDYTYISYQLIGDNQVVLSPEW